MDENFKRAAESNGGRAARPITNPDSSGGLTKREEIAARVLAGLVANPHDKAWGMNLDEMASTSVRAADYLLIELEKPRQVT